MPCLEEIDWNSAQLSSWTILIMTQLHTKGFKSLILIINVYLENKIKMRRSVRIKHSK